MSTSFPFLKIARDFGKDYGAVLLMSTDVANRLDMGGRYASAIAWNMEHNALLRAVVAAINAERQRRATITHNTNHTGDAP